MTRSAAFSYKRRGFCPSCLGRRMTDTARNLVERVLPAGVAVRQWVCSLPWWLRVLRGYDSALCADVVKAFEEEVSRALRHRAKRELGLASVLQAHTGSVLFLQRFGSALRWNIHAHLLSLDGAYVREADGVLLYPELSEPSGEDAAKAACRTARAGTEPARPASRPRARRARRERRRQDRRSQPNAATPGPSFPACRHALLVRVRTRLG